VSGLARGQRAGRRTYVKVQAAGADINMTPLVDVVLVLLIIFMVSIPVVSRSFDVEVPEQPKPDELPISPDTQLVLEVGPQGQLQLNGHALSEAEYVPRLREVIAKRSPHKRTLFFAPADATSYGRLAAAFDGARAAGVETLGMAPLAEMAADGRR
jgi:biopolymer transport protein ExbD